MKICIEFTYSNPDGSCKSVLDHIILSESLKEYICSYNKTVDNVDNMSDHLCVM